MTTCTPKYGAAHKVIAPFGTTLDCVMGRGAFGARQMAQSSVYADYTSPAFEKQRKFITNRSDEYPFYSRSSQNCHSLPPPAIFGNQVESLQRGDGV